MFVVADADADSAAPGVAATAVAVNLIGLSPEHLSELLGLISSSESHSTHILIIDCRSFLAHHDSHIIHSINVFCPPFLRRRNGTKPLLSTLFADGSIRDRLLSNYYFHVVLYDEIDQTPPPPPPPPQLPPPPPPPTDLHHHYNHQSTKKNLQPDSIAFYVAHCLQEEAGIKFINYLEGGFTRFRNRYPLLCTNPPKPLLLKPAVAMAATTVVAGAGSATGGAVVTTKSKTFNRLSKRSNYNQYIHTWPFRSKTSKTFFKPTTPTAKSFYDDFPRIIIEDQTEPAELLPYLYLGNECHASSKILLRNLGITAVLNVSQNCPNHFEEEFYYKRIPISDSKCDDITIRINEALDFIDEMRDNGRNGKILVHCQAGISRSATICIAYLIKTKRIRMEEAYEFVKARRRLISPNFNFMTQLMEFEDQVFSDNKQI